MFYLPADSYATHVHFEVPESKKVRETWFNTISGEYQENGIQSFHNWKEYRKPWEGIPSVIILEVQD